MHRFVLYVSFNETFFFTKLVQYRVIFLFSFYIKKNFQIYDFFFISGLGIQGHVYMAQRWQRWTGKEGWNSFNESVKFKQQGNES